MRGIRRPDWRQLLGALWAPSIASALFLWSGGVWDHVGNELHGMCLHKYEYAGRALRELHLPLWNRNEFCGVPLLAFPQGAMLYPPVPILFAWLAPRTALQVLSVAHILLLGAAVAIYLKRHQVAWLPAGIASLVAIAGIFTARGSFGVDHPALLLGLAWLPVLLVCWENAVVGSAARWTALLAVAAGAQWLAGYPDFPLDTAVLLGVLALVRGEAGLGRRLAIVVVGLGLGAALAAVQILPTAEAIRESVRLKYSYTEGRSALFGVHALADLARGDRIAFLPALVVAVVGFGPPARVRLAWLVALLWCAFPLNPPFSLLYRLPPFSGVRYPFGWEYSGPIFLGFLAAAALDTLWQKQRWWIRIPTIGVGAFVGAHALFAIWRLPGVVPARAPDYGMLANRAADVRTLTRRRDLPPARLLAVREIEGGSLLRFGLPSPTGFEPSVPPRRIAELLAGIGVPVQMQRGAVWPGVAKNPDLAALLGVGLVAAEPRAVGTLGQAGFIDLGRLPPDDVLLYRPPIPRARLVHRTIVVGDEAASLEQVTGHAREASAAAVVEADAGTVPLGVAPEGAAESATIVVDEPDHLAIDAVAASPALLVVTDTFYPGWYARVDRNPAPILRADYAFRAVALPAGTHHVEFRYEPASVRIGMAVTGIAAVVVALLLVLGRAAR